MKTVSLSLTVCVALVASLFPITTEVASAAHVKLEATKASYTYDDPALGATVNLYCRLKAGGKTLSASGSGVIISERGVILTNAHVAQFFLLGREKTGLRSECSVRTGSPAKARYTAEILYIPPAWLEDNVSKISERQPKGTGENDFALLYITGTQNKASLPAQFPYLSASVFATTSENAAVKIAGYPSEKLDFNQIRSKLMAMLASSTVTDTKNFDLSRQPDVIALAPSAAASEGISGGPIVDAAGRVLGIVAIKSSAKEDLRLRGISIPYINRALYLQTRLALPSFLAGNFAEIASSTRASISERLIRQLESGLRRMR